MPYWSFQCSHPATWKRTTITVALSPILIWIAISQGWGGISPCWDALPIRVGVKSLNQIPFHSLPPVQQVKPRPLCFNSPITTHASGRDSNWIPAAGMLLFGRHTSVCLWSSHVLLFPSTLQGAPLMSQKRERECRRRRRIRS